jgi:hypothetical protein
MVTVKLEPGAIACAGALIFTDDAPVINVAVAVTVDVGVTVLVMVGVEVAVGVLVCVVARVGIE